MLNSRGKMCNLQTKKYWYMRLFYSDICVMCETLTDGRVFRFQEINNALESTQTGLPSTHYKQCIYI